MRINMAQLERSETDTVKYNKISNYAAPDKEKSIQGDGYRLDISGTVMDDAAFDFSGNRISGKKGQGKTLEESLQDVENYDPQTMHNYMAVMSNCMSDEDFGELLEGGGQIGNAEIKEVVTIVDRIKTAMVKGGANIAGYTDTLDADTLKEITGSETFANELANAFAKADLPLSEETAREAADSYAKAKTLQPLSDGALKYLVENGREPTVDNLYLAQHSGAGETARQGYGYFRDDVGGYLSKKADDVDLEKISAQIEEIVTDAGYTPDERTKSEAGFLVEAGVVLNRDTFSLLHTLRDVALPENEEALEKQLARALADAVAFGKSPKDALLAGSFNPYEEAERLTKRVRELPETAADESIRCGETPTLSRLFRENEAQSKAEDNAADTRRTETESAQAELVTGGDSAAADTRIIEARLTLVNVQLRMTAEAGCRLLKEGFPVTLAPLEELAEALKSVRDELYAGLSDTQISLYEETTELTAKLPSIPAVTLGRFTQGAASEITLRGLYLTGEETRASFTRAGEAYEQLMTAPRADLGDSIRKAFRNVDDLLSENGFEVNDENRRAARILGYNGIELTEENVGRARDTDAQVQAILRRMKPENVLQMIRDGVDPLSSGMDELGSYFDGQNDRRDAERETERFAKFLHTLDKKKEIGSKERASYIGVYRFPHRLEKDDGAAIGALLKENREITFGNLLTAMRSAKHRGREYAVDDGFGGMQEKPSDEAKIDEQILTAYTEKLHAQKSLANEAADTFSPALPEEKLPKEETTLEGFVRDIRDTAQDAEAQEAYVRDTLSGLRETVNEASEQTIRELLHYEQPVTVNDLQAMEALLYRGNEFFLSLKKYTERQGAGEAAEDDGGFADYSVEGETESWLSALRDRESAQAAAEASGARMEEALDVALETREEISFDEVREIQAMRSRIRLSTRLARSETYEVPVEIDGELTSIRLRVERGREKGRIAVTMDCKRYGALAAELKAEKKDGALRVTGYVAGDSREGVESFEREALAPCKEALAEGGADASRLTAVFSARLDRQAVAGAQERITEEADGASAQENAVSGEELYGIASRFVRSVYQAGRS